MTNPHATASGTARVSEVVPSPPLSPPPSPGPSLPRVGSVIAGIGLVVVALAVRWPFRNEISGDYRAFIGPWYDYIAGHGGFAALSAQFSNYNPPYLYLVVVATWLPLPAIVAVKLISVVFDLLLAFAVYRLVTLRPGWTWQPLAAAAVALLLPTVVLNSSYWGQCDSIYASLALLSLHQLLRRRAVWAAVLIGLAISFKLQAVFLLPVLAMIWIARPLPWRRSLAALATIPVTFVAMLVPALAAGASPAALARIYPAQIDGSGDGAAAAGGRGGGTAGRGGFGQGGFGGPGATGGVNPGAAAGNLGGGSSSAPYTRNAASFYQWLSSDAGTVWKYVGFALAAAAIGLAIGVAWRNRRWISTRTLVGLSAAMLVAIPFFLPEMHDRYFYLGDALLVAGAFVLPRLILSAIAAQGASLIAYAAYLWNGTISLRWASLLELIALAGCVAAVAWSVRQDRLIAPDRGDPRGGQLPPPGIARRKDQVVEGTPVG